MTVKSGNLSLKAAVINILIITMDQMTMCKVKGVARSDKPAKLCITLQFLSDVASFIASFSTSFSFSGPQLYRFGSLSPFS